MKEHISHTRLPFSCGAGEASVNVRTGRMTFTHPDLETGDGDYAVAVAHVYNPEIPFSEVPPCMGNGWKLNVQRYVIPDAGNNGSESDKFTYVDETGYSHRFGQSHKASRYHYADGSNLTLQVLEAKGSRYEITDGAGNQLYFDAAGKLASIVSEQNSVAEKVFEYDGEKLICIYDARKPSKKITFQYEQNLLSTITYGELTNESVRVIKTLCYGYDAKGNLTGIIRKTWNSADKKELVEPVAYFEYDLETDIGTSAYPVYNLTKAAGGKDKSALQIDYADTTSEGVYRVQKVTTGVSSVTTESKKCDPYVYEYGVENKLATAFGSESKPVFLIGAMSESKAKAWTEFSVDNDSLSEDRYMISAKNDKGIIAGYVFNKNGSLVDA